MQISYLNKITPILPQKGSIGVLLCRPPGWSQFCILQRASLREGGVERMRDGGRARLFALTKPCIFIRRLPQSYSNKFSYASSLPDGANFAFYSEPPSGREVSSVCETEGERDCLHLQSLVYSFAGSLSLTQTSFRTPAPSRREPNFVLFHPTERSLHSPAPCFYFGLAPFITFCRSD